MATETTQERTEELTAPQRTATDPAVIAAGASVLLSLYYFFVEGDRQKGVFVGLWPPTIFAFVSYFKQASMTSMLEDMTRSGGVRESVQRMVSGE